jgi:hypothetical protein
LLWVLAKAGGKTLLFDGDFVVARLIKDSTSNQQYSRLDTPKASEGEAKSQAEDGTQSHND